MKADLSRSTFDPARHVKRVPLQQGRVQTDADANELQDVVFHRAETTAADLVGGCGGPIGGAGFEITADGGGLAIGAGRYYLSGWLVENEADVAYDAQPHLPLDAGAFAELDPGGYLATLDAWEWHRTALDMPEIREVALGGPDTATRTQVVWQVRLHPLAPGEPTDCASPVPSWDAATAPSTGQLGARADQAAASDDPCVVEPGAGYRRLENQLYRVEVHTGGNRGATVCKWDRDNGTVLSRLEAQNPTQTEWILGSVGRDAVLRFATGDWAELTDDARELHGLPGTLVRVTAVEGDTLTVDLDSRLPVGGAADQADFADPKVRRWNGVLPPLDSEAFRNIEDGVQVRLRGDRVDGADRRYRTGDYWTIPARTNTGDVEWPATDDGWVSAAGITHHHCRLAQVTIDEEGGVEVADCRTLFPPVTELTGLFYVGGDGQEGDPGAPLGAPLQVGVANGSHPVEGARVRFEVVSGSGSASPAEASTGADGTAAAVWTLGPEGEQAVEAVLLDAAGDPVHLPIRFGAAIEPLVLDYVGGDGQQGWLSEPLAHPLQVGVSRGGEPVAGARVRFRVTSGDGTVDGAPTRDVPTGADGTARVGWTLGPDGEQRVEALLIGSDGIATHLPVRFAAQPGSSGEEDPGFHVVDVRWQSDGTPPLRNDTDADLGDLDAGLAVTFDAAVAPESILGGPSQEGNFPLAKPVCVLTLWLPYPLDDAERDVWQWDDGPGFGTRPIRLDGTLSLEEKQLFWTPTNQTRRWIESNPLETLTRREVADRVLATVTLAGDKIWAEAEGQGRVYLDGEAFGAPRGTDDGTDVILPSGDRRRGSDFEMWFWLVEKPQTPSGDPAIRVDPAGLPFGSVSVGLSVNRTVQVSNVGTGTLTGQASVAIGPQFFLVSEPAFSVEPSQSQALVVRFSSPEPAAYADQLLIESNDPNAPTVSVPLTIQNVGEPPSPRGPFVQFIHDFKDAGPVEVHFNGSTVAPAGSESAPFPHGASTPSLPVDAGRLKVEVRTLDGEVVLRDEVTVEVGKAYVVVLSPTPGTGAPRLVVTSGAHLDARARDSVDVTVVHALASARPARARVAVMERTRVRDTLADGLALGERAGYRALDPKRTSLRLEVGDASETVRLDLRGREGQAVVLVLSGVAGESPEVLAFTSEGQRVRVG